MKSKNNHLLHQWNLIAHTLKWWCEWWNSKGFHFSSSISACEPIYPQHVYWGNPTCLTAIILAAIGCVFTIAILAIFIIYRDAAVVKASTRELMWVILLAMLLGHASVALVLLRPSKIPCALQRIFPGLAFTIIYAALVTKTNRIARILEGSKRILLKKQRFLSTPAQLVITGSKLKLAWGQFTWQVDLYRR